MARLDVQTFEVNSTTANVLGGDTFTSSTIGTTHVRTGTYAMRVSSLSSGTAQGYNKKWQATASTVNFFRAYVYVVTVPSAANTIMAITASSSLASSVRCSMALKNDGTLILQNASNAQIGSASSAINDSNWHMLELKLDTTPSTGSRVIEARLDGSVFATSSVQTTGTASDIYVGGNGLAEAQTTGEWWFDDLALNDNSGSFQNTYPGSANISRAFVNGAGDSNGFLVQVGGTVGSANNYTRVNEVTPNDATSYNASAVLNAEDLFTIDVSGIPATATINAILVGVRAADIAGADTTTGIKLEMMKASGGTKAQSANIVPDSTSWSTNGPSTPRNYQLVLYQDPDGANWNPATWTPQIGYTIDATAVRAVGVTNIWAEIDYTTSSSPAVAVSDTTTTSENVAVTITGGVTTLSINASDTTTTSENVPTPAVSYGIDVEPGPAYTIQGVKIV